MVGGMVQIKCNEEQYKRFCNSEAFTALIDFCKEHAVNLNMEFHSIMGIEWAQADYGTQNSSLTHDDLEGVIFKYESNLVDFWNRENRRELLDQIEDWFALGEVIEMNEWWVDESRKDKIDARKEWAKDNTKTIENWRKFYRKAEK